MYRIVEDHLLLALSLLISTNFNGDVRTTTGRCAPAQTS